MTHPHVLLIHLGPVQELIASARKCRDLWFGSWTLSELSKAAAAGIAEEVGVDALVFPAPIAPADLAKGSRMSVANKLVARVTGDAARVRDVAERGEKVMRERLQGLREKAFARVGGGDPLRGERFLIETARAQVDEVYEYLWVAVAEGEGEEAYAKARSEAERLLAARKNTRAWAQPSWAKAGVPKSSLDGQRESVIHEDVYDNAVRPDAGPRRGPALTPDERRRWYGVHGAERLCGVGVFKRWGSWVDETGQGHHRFFSTAHIAALPTMIGIDQDAERRPEIRATWEKLRAAAGSAAEEIHVVPGRGTRLFGKVDGAVLFASRLAENEEEDGRDAKAALAALSDFYRAAKRGEPLAYYAILVADGDGMGALIREKTTVEAHRAFSRDLDGFAQGARGIVGEHEGCLIYSGGDDVLALLPLHTAVECAAALARSFHEKTGATLSAGLAIVHYTHPLGDALEVAREAEKLAKAFHDEAHAKDALAIALDKRSGGTTIACGHWRDLAPRLLDLVKLHEADAIPDKAGHELAALDRLGDELGEIKRSEALRILGRKRARRGQEKVAQETLEMLERLVGPDPMALGRELSIAGLIAKAKAEAKPQAEEGA